MVKRSLRKTTKTILQNPATSPAQEPEPELESDPALVLENEQLFTNIGTPSLEQQADLQLQVRTILAHNCYDCHGPEKVKGDLRLDHIDLIMKGGESGPVVVPGNANASELYKRISLPEGHEDIMPSKGKNSLNRKFGLLPSGSIQVPPGQTASRLKKHSGMQSLHQEILLYLLMLLHMEIQ